MRPLLLTLFLLITGPVALHAEEGTTVEQKVLNASDTIGDAVELGADKLDMILSGGKRYTQRANNSKAKISQLVTWSEGGVVKKSTDFGINLRLPNVEKRWALRFTSYDEEEERRDMQQRTVRTRPRERQYGAALMFLKKLGSVRITFQPKLELRDPLFMSYVLRFESSAESGPVRIVPKVELFADPKKGTGEFAGLEFITQLSERWELSFQNEETYRERGNIFNTSHGVTLDYALADDKGLGWSLVGSSNSRPSFHLDTLRVATTYGQSFYSGKLNAGLTPFLSFGKPDHFKGDAGISLNVSVIF